MARTGAQGLAIATIANGNVRNVQAFGSRNARGESLNADAVMYGASLTKAVFGHYAAQLATEGRLDLDRLLCTPFCHATCQATGISTHTAIEGTSPAMITALRRRFVSHSNRRQA